MGHYFLDSYTIWTNGLKATEPYKNYLLCACVCKLRCVLRDTGVCAGPVREKQREINTKEREKWERAVWQAS